MWENTHSSIVGQADVILANSHFTARVTKHHFPSIRNTLKVVHPGIDLSSYQVKHRDTSNPDVRAITSSALSSFLCLYYIAQANIRDRPTLLSLNRFEAKKNVALAIEAFALLRSRLREAHAAPESDGLRLVLAGVSSSFSELEGFVEMTVLCLRWL
jgi:alpha-1,3/alpha-1,6-mannosyltransferase